MMAIAFMLAAARASSECAWETGDGALNTVAFSVAEGAVFSRNDDEGKHGWCLDLSVSPEEQFIRHTTFSKLRVDLATLRIDANDHTYAAQVAGDENLQLGYASDCNQKSYSTLGEAVIDLRGTPFVIANISSEGKLSCECKNSGNGACSCSQWKVGGWNSAMTLNCTADQQKCTVRCGGSSGWCSLAAGYLQLEYLPGYGIANVCASSRTLPHNTGISLVADVASTTVANDVYWAEQCKAIPASARFLVLDMGTVRDFFKPTEGNTYCEMLQAHDKHQWSPNGVDWFDVEFYPPRDTDNGGSNYWWPRDKGREGDVRRFLSFWGYDGSAADATGGCCSPSPAIEETDWGEPFTVSYALPLQPLPPYTEMTLVADVAGTTVANDAYWAEKCKAIPSSTLFLVLDMGAVRDFFKPVDATTTYCEMLQRSDEHQWSSNGLDWVPVDFASVLHHGNNGGSNDHWPRDHVEGDSRKSLSYWGRDKDVEFTGGCCSTSPEKDIIGWGLPFTVSFQTVPKAPPFTTKAELKAAVNDWVADAAGEERPVLKQCRFWCLDCTNFGDVNGSCTNLTNIIGDQPNLLRCWATCEARYPAAELRYGQIEDWDTSRVTDMSSLFASQLRYPIPAAVSSAAGFHTFNADLSKWDTSRVLDMNHMFSHAYAFNSDLSKWSTGNVKNMQGMFFSAYSFNANIEAWDVSTVSNMYATFDMSYVWARGLKTPAFNADLSHWDVSNIGTMEGMFLYSTQFNQNLDCWSVNDRVNMKPTYSIFPYSFVGNQLPCWCGDFPTCPRKPTVFTTNDELKAAVAEWIADETAAKMKHGQLRCWDVSEIGKISIDGWDMLRSTTTTTTTATSTSATSTTTTTAAIPVATTTSSLHSANSSADVGAAAKNNGGMVAGVVVAVLLLCGATVVVVLRRRRASTQQRLERLKDDLSGNETVEMIENPLRAHSMADGVGPVQRQRIQAREYEPPLGLPGPGPAPAGDIYYSEVGDPSASATYAKPNGGAAEYAAGGHSGSATYAQPDGGAAEYVAGSGPSGSATYAQQNGDCNLYAPAGDGGGLSAAIYSNDAYGNVPGSTTNA